MPWAKHINFLSLLVLDSPVGQRRLVLPTPPHSNYCEALIWSDELHKRCVNCIGNISELQPGPRTTLTESVTFEYSDILIVYKTPSIYEWALKSPLFSLSVCLSVYLAPLQHNLYSSKIAEHVLPSYAKFKNLLNCWKFWLNDTNQVWLSKNWKELDVYSRENYSVFTNLLYNNDFKDYVIARTSVIPPSHVESSFISDKIFRSCFFGSVI